MVDAWAGFTVTMQDPERCIVKSPDGEKPALGGTREREPEHKYARASTDPLFPTCI